jgi:hypothetical protein
MDSVRETPLNTPSPPGHFVDAGHLALHELGMTTCEAEADGEQPAIWSHFALGSEPQKPRQNCGSSHSWLLWIGLSWLMNLEVEQVDKTLAEKARLSTDDW